MKPYKANHYFALLLVVLGIYGFLAYYIQYSEPTFTSLIPLMFGLVLWPMTPALKKDNSLIGHTAAMLTIIIMIASAVMLTRSIFTGDFSFGRKELIFGLIIVAAFWALVIYMRYFLARRKDNASSV